MRIILRSLILLLPLPCFLLGQSWEVGAVGGYGISRDVSVTSGSTTGKTGFAPGYTFGGLLGNQISRHFGGEIRYTYQADDMHVTSGSTETKASAHSQAIHYDILIHATSKESAIRPFLAVGGGVKFYQGTGVEQPYQPLGNLVLLTRTTEAQPLVSVGGGVKFAATKRTLVRLDFRDYATPIPTNLLATPGTSKISGWIHDFVFLVGVSTTF